MRLRPQAVGEAVRDTRAFAAERGLAHMTWWVGDAATPADVGDRLVSQGLTLRERLASLALEAPPQGTPPFPARPARDLAEYVAAQEVDWHASGVDERRRSALLEQASASWEREGEYGRTFVVVDDERVIAVGRSRYGEDAVFLTGGATAPDARGRGAYTSLVHARWHDAVERGTPLLVTQATAMSAPVLRRVGFRDVGAVELYVDRL